MVYLQERYGRDAKAEEDRYQLPPQNVESEEAILGGCLLDPGCYDRIKDLITTPEMFYIRSHQTIWRAIAALGKKGNPTDLMSVTSDLKDRGKLDDIGGISKMAHLVETTVSAVNADHYAKLISTKYHQRRLIHVGHEFIEWGYEAKVRSENISSLFERVRSRIEEITEFSAGESPLERERARFESKLKEVENIVLNIEEIAFRDELLDKLGKKYGTTGEKLIARYYKSLIGSKNGN
ncbi:DnaB-like helicase N-terminal domain-containing protein, partial [Spirulina sp. 06S082]|uniref:DnaB-like helicase N-terminal domain-containing protein n=1 Tax=Spirulina sp. 06S082 TaxID=3110248 RepID=UPI002B20E255